MKYVSILGSTGSIGTQALEVIANNKNLLKAQIIAANTNDKLLEQQIEYFKPKTAVLVDKKAADRLVSRYRGSTTILCGEEGLMEAASDPSIHTVLTAMVGFVGLKPTLAAIEAKKDIALANKETLVAAGEIVMNEAKKNNVKILPVDSEHSAIFQCLQGQHSHQVKRIILTASGGPFRGKSKNELKNITTEDCLAHPNWAMGKKITVDSATLANKGLEAIEAKWLFDLKYSQIQISVHPQSIIHSMVEYNDGSILAQLGQPDMKLPIQYALTYPERLKNPFPKLDFKNMKDLTFEQPDKNTFQCLSLALAAGRIAGTMPCVFNAANEVAVYAFLENKINFLNISEVIREVMRNHKRIKNPSLEDIFETDNKARITALKIIENIYLEKHSK
ncbi:1-deoxy-D-xylulose-5-phosphate reductoisomerase [Selenomonadales bacterium OttesenSCG-928-I06]|nr:1-deoxy-D-xylulose-5-phosphate reductoisomerase [Selenomonadales bacterium OttesenSCG-928-I06]